MSKSVYLCSNCRHKIETEHHGHGGPMCPNCKVEQMTEMRRPECGDCENDTFMIYDSERARVGSPDPQIECVECGWTGTIDEDGVWY